MKNGLKVSLIVGSCVAGAFFFITFLSTYLNLKSIPEEMLNVHNYDDDIC